ncbi:hypothetical protein QUB56_16110 [Microcoleus sp. AR_TQ3_B6]|uniref:hypothetical protein n=1 Tax=Microcoleus sp. AR_TQ3_B6 TaxID=3055284 RepID=UPI002FD4F0EE
MIWQEFLVDRNLTENEIANAIANLFLIPLTDVLVVDDIVETDVSERVRVVCERMSVEGDFSIRLSIYLRDSNLDQSDSTLKIGQFCELLNCQCLVSDESVNPYQWRLVQSSETWKLVYLDPRLLDENEEYIIQNPCESK